MIKRILKVIFFIFIIFGIFKGIQIHHDVKQVLQYRSLVREALANEDTTANENLILAMIYTETKGREDDLMQASESASGETNTISDNKASIRQGIQTLSDDLKEAKKKGVDSWTAVQAYNFGKDYIDYVAPSLGNVTGKTYLYLHPISLLNGMELYVNGGNIYYSRLVETNMTIMNLFSWF